MWKVISLAVAAGSVLAGAAYAQGERNWSPQSFPEMQTVVVQAANAKGESVIGLFIRPDHFAEDVATAKALYLDPALVRKRKVSDMALLTPVEVEISRVDVRAEYFRAQDDDVVDAPYRSAVTTYDIDCASGEVGTFRVRYYSGNEAGGELVDESIAQTTNPERSIPRSGTFSAAAVSALCNDQYQYVPQ